MATVHKIEICEAAAGKDENGYQISLKWTIDEGPGSHYTGPYQVVITDGKQFRKNETIDNAVRCDLSGLALDEKQYYTAEVSLPGGNIVSEKVHLLIRSYTGVTGTYDGETISLKWDAPANDIAYGTCIVSTKSSGMFSYEIGPCVKCLRIPFPEDNIGSLEQLQIMLTPYTSGESTGPQSTLSLFRPRYMLKKEEDGSTVMVYHGSGPDETAVSVELGDDLYVKEHPAEAITAGPLSLSVTKPYTLTINTAIRLVREDYLTWVKKAAEVVSAEGMYQLLEVIARTVKTAPEDILFYHCGFYPQERRADVRPGLRLKVEQEIYMPKCQSSDYSTAGFVGNHTTEYAVSLTRKEQLEYLEFDSFIGKMSEEICAVGETGDQNAGAGILDLSDIRLRQPYYRIQYPEAFFQSALPPTPYASDHVLLMAAPGWQEVSVPVEGEKTAAGIPYLFFRGRSAITLCINVFLNGQRMSVPVGTTYHEILQQAGVGSGQAGSLYRRDAWGRSVKVELQQNIPLINGDRIEV